MSKLVEKYVLEINWNLIYLGEVGNTRNDAYFIHGLVDRFRQNVIRKLSKFQRA